MTRKADTRVSDASWGVETLRLTLFHQKNAAFPSGDIWEQVTGKIPDSSSEQPKSGTRVVIGDVDGSQLALQLQPREGRIDWVLKSDESPDVTPASFPDIASVFLTLMNVFLGRKDVPPVIRMAFGAIVLLPVSSVEEGYSTISNYLNFDLDGSSSSDFMYQINRKRASKANPNSMGNRLTKWSVGKVTKHSLAIADEGLVSLQDPEITSVACRLTLDINTVPHGDAVLSSDRYEPILWELFDWGREIIRQGDIE